METLVALQQTNGQDIQQRLDQLLGSFVDNDGKTQSYFETFNHDLGVINHLLLHPPSESACYQRAFECQEEYNKAMDFAKKRWEKGNKEFDVGKVIVKDLATRKKQYEEVLDTLQVFEQKQKEIQSFLDHKDPQDKQSIATPWRQLQAISAEQDQADLDDVANRLNEVAKKLDEQDKGKREVLLNQVIGMHTFDKKEDYKTWLLNQANLLNKNGHNKHVEMLSELFSLFSGRVNRLNKLREDWQAQGAFAHSSTDDLLKIKGEIDNFVVLIDFIEKALPTKLTTLDIKIKEQLEKNRKVIDLCRQQIEAAAIWRIQGAVQYSNLRLDDALFVLKREFSNAIFQFDEAQVLNRFANIGSIDMSSISYGCSLQNFNDLHKLLIRSSKINVQEKWLSSKWIKNSDKRNIIPVSVKGKAIIPDSLLPFVPEEPHYFPPGGWIRYWFFRTNELLTGFWGWVRKVWVGSSNEAVTLINETYRQIDSFEKRISDIRVTGKVLNLSYIGQSSSFLDALEIPSMIAAEKKRTKQMVTKGILGTILRWLPFFKVKLTAEFSETWLKEIERAEVAINKKATKIANYIMEDFEWMLLDSIEKKSFILPANLMSNLEKYIENYGSEADLKRLQQIASPIHIIRKFKFLVPPKDNEIFRNIDDDNVTSFLRYAQKYWTTAQVEAVRIIIGMITRDNIPENAAEDKVVYEKVKCLLTEQDKPKAFTQLMEMIAKDFIYTTGDDGNDRCLQFLGRHAPDAARTWRAHRNDDLDEKFTFINNLLTGEPGQEKVLTDSGHQQIGKTQFKFQHYERYIKDIQQAESKEQQRRLSLLKKQAATYVRNYDGDNLVYQNLLFSLCKIPPEPFVIEYCEKRFAWLIDQDNQDLDVENSDKEEQFVANIKSHPVILSRLVDLINERTSATDDQLASWVLRFNEPLLTATYFSKRFQKMLSDDKLRDILEDGDFFEQLLANPLFSKKVYSSLSEKLAAYAREENWDALCDDQFFRVIEKIGTLQNKEAYRLLMIKYLLKMNNSDLTEKYITKLAEHVGATNLDKLITLPKGKQLLVEIVSEHVAMLGQKQQWQGHAQYFIEFYLPAENKALRQDIRLKWLAEFIRAPQKFTGTGFIERSTLDGKYHYQNKQVPNDSLSLAEFYGEVNIPRVRELLMERLDKFNENLSDDVIQLINSHFRDPAFNLHESWPLFRKKRDLFQQAQKTIHCLKNGLFVDGVSQLESFYVQMQGVQALATVENGLLHQQTVQYQQLLFSQILEVVRESCKELFVNSVSIEEPSQEGKAAIEALGKQQKLLIEMLGKASLPSDFKREMHEVYKNRSLCITKLNHFLANVNFEKLHLITFDSDDLELFSKTLSKKRKHFLKIQLNTLKDYLPPEDPLALSLAAWYRVLKGNYEMGGTEAADLSQLENYQATVKNYPKMAEDMAARLITALDAREELTYFPLFKESRVSYQSMQYLTDATQTKLLTSLKAKIEWLLIQSDPTHAQFSRVDWSYHAKLLEGICQATAHNKSIPQAIAGIAIWVSGCLSDVEKQLKLLLEELDSRTQSKMSFAAQYLDPTLKKDNQLSILEKEHLLVKNALFVRVFGSKTTTDKLDQLLSEISRRQHLAMMKGASSMLIEHSLDFADKLLTTAGSDRQREQCAALADKWNLYRTQPTTSDLPSIRKLAVNDALPGYIQAFDKSIYNYFVKKHNLPTDFHEQMLEKTKEWHLTEALLEPERILKKHPLSEFLAILTPLASKATHGFFYSKPSESDACKLFVSFCLSIQAHQLAKLWQNRQANHQNLQLQFAPSDISGTLNTLVNQLAKKYDIGRGDFNKGLFTAIAKDNDYFASWSSVAMPVIPVAAATGTSTKHVYRL